MKQIFREFRDFFVSLKLTVVLLALSIILVFAATLDQVNLGVWAVQAKYFHSLFVLSNFGHIPVPVFPGGYLIGGLLLINLIAAHIYRFKLSWRKSGILLAHFGLILLLVGELLAGLMQQEFNMQIHEGQTKNYAESYRRAELAITDVTNPKYDDVVAIPQAILARRETVQYPKLPFRVAVRAYYPNASLAMRPPTATPGDAEDPATRGIGLRMTAIPEPMTYKENERNTPAAFVELIGPQGSLGTFLVSDQIPTPQHFDFGGRAWKIVLRLHREYEPFTLKLLKFSHDVYPGTNIPKNFSSRILLRSDDGHTNREVRIYMNNPLRYAGLTFYQAGYQGEHTTILQVVRNPSWVVPYISCALIALGLLIQFGLHLAGFIGKQRRRAAGGAAGAPGATAPRPTGLRRFVPALVLLVAIAAVGASLLPPRNPGAFNLTEFGRLPVLASGRFKPLDTVARTSLLEFQNRQAVRSPLVSKPLVPNPTAWLLDVVFRPEKADNYPTFIIDNPELQTLVGKSQADLHITYPTTMQRLLASVGFLPSEYRRFSFKELEPHFAAIEEQARLAQQVDSAARNAFQRAVIQLYGSLVRYQQLRFMFVMPGSPDFLGDLLLLQDKLQDGIAAVRAKQAGKPHDERLANAMLEMGRRFTVMAQDSDFLVIPPERGMGDPLKWQTTGAALLDTFQTGRVNPVALAYAGLQRAWREQSPEKFNTLLSIFRADLVKRYKPELHKSDIETRFNAAAPFYVAMNLYIAAFFLAIASWLLWPDALGRSAFWLVGVAWLVTTAGILTRMWLEGRPPVTNLYSSSLFVGWGSVALCLGLEYSYRNGIGSAAAGVIGFATLLIAHMLSLSGDTLEMMRAVLDSNFWLATHVVVVTLGYAATFLAGFLALIYVLRGLFTRSLDQDTASALNRMVYGIVCFATLFSFAGTVLGGIWADQSWGRFWGWDPKENGALIIVVWNAIILHARWGGMVKQRGLMTLAIFGNIVTSWSWFGTNMLGIGLHSYGFTEAAFWALSAFVATQLGFIALALVPQRYWRSFRPRGGKSKEPLAATHA